MLSGIDEAKQKLGERIKEAPYAAGVVAIEHEGKQGVNAFIVGTASPEQAGMQVYALRKLADKLSLTLIDNIGEDNFMELMKSLSNGAEERVINDDHEVRRTDV